MTKLISGRGSAEPDDRAADVRVEAIAAPALRDDLFLWLFLRDCLLDCGLFLASGRRVRRREETAKPAPLVFSGQMLAARGALDLGLFSLAEELPDLIRSRRLVVLFRFVLVVVLFVELFLWALGLRLGLDVRRRRPDPARP